MVVAIDFVLYNDILHSRLANLSLNSRLALRKLLGDHIS